MKKIILKWNSFDTYKNNLLAFSFWLVIILFFGFSQNAFAIAGTELYGTITSAGVITSGTFPCEIPSPYTVGHWTDDITGGGTGSDNTTGCGFMFNYQGIDLTNLDISSTTTDGEYHFYALYDDSWGTSASITNNTYFMVFNRTAGVWTDNSPATIGITNTAPQADAINVNAFVTFLGTYDNDGTYDTILIGYTNLDVTNVVLQLKVCDIAEIGTGLPYTCNVSLSTNTHYQFSPSLWDSNIDFPDGMVMDSEAPYYFTTGLVYEVQTPPVSSTCSGFDVGCYLENAISWTFGISQETLNQFGDLTLKNSLPFSYIYDMGTLYDEAFNQAPQDINIAIAFGSFGEITLLSTDKLQAIPFQGTVRTVIGAIMVFGTAMLVYRKIIGVHDKQEVKQV